MPAACALGMISGKIIFYFEIAERLRTLRYLIFTRGHLRILPQSPAATDSPFCRCATSSPGAGEGGCERSEQTEGVFAAALSGAKPEGVCTLSHKKRAYGRGKAVHCAKNEGFLLPNGGKRAIL